MVKRLFAVGQNFTRSVDRPLTLSPRNVMVTCLTHGDGVGGRRGGGEFDAGDGGGGRGVGKSKHLGERRVLNVPYSRVGLKKPLI